MPIDDCVPPGSDLCRASKWLAWWAAQEAHSPISKAELKRLARSGLPVANYCGCGCGALVFSPERHWVYRFAEGHSHSVPRRPRKEVHQHARAHKIARMVMPRDECALAAIGGCVERLEIHHIDKNVNNNALSNLICLCSAHHRLVDTGRIDLADPVMPQFYTDPRGERRYLGSEAATC